VPKKFFEKDAKLTTHFGLVKQIRIFGQLPGYHKQSKSKMGTVINVCTWEHLEKRLDLKLAGCPGKDEKECFLRGAIKEAHRHLKKWVRVDAPDVYDGPGGMRRLDFIDL
jgi:hypothetical protein